jgi:two-component system, OmpR family, phosphate regulon response regulator PhoB
MILVCCSDMEFYALLEHILDMGGFASKLARSADEAMQIAISQNPLAAILDCSSPPAPAICTSLKRNARTQEIAIVALIGNGSEMQRSELRSAGADQCFTRPLAPARLLEFLRAALAALPLANDGRNPNDRLKFADLEMNLDTYRVYRNGKEVHLCPIEFRLLRHMLARPGKVFSRNELIRAAWPRNIFVEARTVDVHIGRLRRTLKAAAKTDMIRTVRSAGYALTD